MPEPIPTIKFQPIIDKPSGLRKPKKVSSRKLLIWFIFVLIAIIVGTVIGGIIWYNVQLSPLGNDKGQLKLITIKPGRTQSQIGYELEKQSIIRSSVAFDIYTRLSCSQNVLQAGTYRLSPAETIPQIVEHFVNGSVDQFSITFFPGATLTDITNNTKKYDVTTVLTKAGYTTQEISEALSMTYDSPLFAGRPSGKDLEGYVYGETYNFNTGASVSDILRIVFSEFYSVVEDNGLINSFASHGLNLYEGITLASIIQREANSELDQKQVAQVFYSRLNLGWMLGSDVTYQYIADKTGVERDPGMDSEYNTRVKSGLPPGPIAVPGLTALMAVAQPAATDYLYFLSGDDDVTYFAHTDTEHEANRVNHCKEKCSTP